MSDKPHIIIYTDGACKGNPGPGGWGAVLKSGEHEKHLHGGEKLTTNNRMEISAVIFALRALKQKSSVELWTDSQYVQKGVTEWLENWKKRGWKTASKDPVKNADLWQELDPGSFACQISRTKRLRKSSLMHSLD
jgi:ribonuclease HI